MANILGLGGSLHDFAACLITDDGKYIAIEDERLSRIRYALGSREPFSQSIAYCLDAAGLVSNHELRIFANDMLLGAINPSLHKNVAFINHHVTHAYCAYFTSMFEESAILVMDGSGSLVSDSSTRQRETTTFAYATRNEIMKLGMVSGVSVDATRAHNSPKLRTNSLGDLYRVFTEMIGFGYLQAGKTMGMSPFGDPRFFDSLIKCVSLHPEGKFEIEIRGENGVVNQIEKIQKRFIKSEQDYFLINASIACAGQLILEHVIDHCLNYLWEKTKSPNLCLAGGVALNSIANARIAKISPFKNVHIPYAPGDDGTAIGAAIFGFLETSAPKNNYKFPNVPYLGRIYTDENMEEALKEKKVHYSTPTEIVKSTAAFLEQNLIVGWFQGSSEFGPRALGNRSLLANPKTNWLHARVNTLKGREWFRPLAPAVIDKYANQYFETFSPSPHMQFAWEVHPEFRKILPVITHINGTARVQTVSENDNPLFYSLLREIDQLCGVPIVTNTSFNIVGEPIVETPKNAIESFINSQIDVLVLGPFLIRKR